MWVPSLGWEDTPGREHVNPLLYSCLENPMNRGAWQAMYSSQGCNELNMTEAMAKKKYSFPKSRFNIYDI